MLLRLDGSGPRYAQLTRALSSLIQNGALPPGARVPPSREMARDLACSRNIVLLAYEQLALEGYLVTRVGGGTFVSPELPKARASVPRSAQSVDHLPDHVRLPRSGRRLVAIAARAREITRRKRQFDIDFMPGLCAPDERLVARMRAAFGAALRYQPFDYPDPAGEFGLRQQLAERLRGVRGITRSAEQILVTSGAQQALDICARLLVAEGDRVAVEDPGYEVAHAAFRAAGATIIPVPVDQSGLDVAALPDGSQPVRLAYVTPSHQYPTGAIMPATRRYALLAWAKRRRAYIIEDDYDSEFRYTGRPIEALAALEPDGPVIYCGTFAKSLFPSLRLGFLALPRGLMSSAVSCKWLSDRGCPLILQRLVSELMAAGEYDRHIRRMLRRYQARREVLIRAVQARFGSAAEVNGSDAGLHVVMWLPHLAATHVDTLVAACQARSLGVYSVARHAMRPYRRAGLMLGYALLDTEQIERGIRVLADAYRELTRLPLSRSSVTWKRP